MRFVTIVRTILVRAVFVCHGLIAVWRLYVVMADMRYWALILPLAFLLMETVIIVYKNGGKEWKWFCPSVFIYMLSVVPSIWFLEINEMNERLKMCRNNTAFQKCATDTVEQAHFDDKKSALLVNNMELILPLKLGSEQWIKTLEQVLLLILIICRWVMPKGKLTHDQLSQLLLVYIGTAADIVEFFEAFKEEKVKCNSALCLAILGIWSVSLLQFCLVLTAAKARQDKSGLLLRNQHRKVTCCEADVFSILISISLQDLPFLTFRMLLIFKYHVLSYTNMFFTFKNSLVILLLIYRLIVVQLHRKKAHEPTISAPYDGRLSSLELNENAIAGSDASSVKSQLLNRGSVSSESIHRINGVNNYRSVGLIRSVPPPRTNLGKDSHRPFGPMIVIGNKNTRDIMPS